MVALVDIQNNEIEGFLIASDTHELRRDFQSLFDYPYPERREQCLQHLYQLEFPRPGKINLQGGYILLVQ